MNHDPVVFGQNPLCVSSCMMDEAPSYFLWTREMVASHLKGHVLEVGCGSGHFTATLVTCPSVEKVTAIDIEQHALDLAKIRLGSVAVEFRSEEHTSELQSQR